MKVRTRDDRAKVALHASKAEEGRLFTMVKVRGNVPLQSESRKEEQLVRNSDRGLTRHQYEANAIGQLFLDVTHDLCPCVGRFSAQCQPILGLLVGSSFES